MQRVVVLSVCASACGDPLLATIGITELDSSVATPGDAQLVAEGAALDAMPLDGDVELGDAALLGPGNCIDLPDLAAQRSLHDAGMNFDATFEVQGVRVGQDQGYNCGDAGGDHIFSLASGQPIMKDGTQYALRVSGVTLVNYSVNGVVNVCERPQLPPLNDVFTKACTAVGAPRGDAYYLRLSGGILFLPVNPYLKLCDQPCQ